MLPQPGFSNQPLGRGANCLTAFSHYYLLLFGTNLATKAFHSLSSNVGHAFEQVPRNWRNEPNPDAGHSNLARHLTGTVLPGNQEMTPPKDPKQKCL